MHSDNFEDLVAEVLGNVDARGAYRENSVRRSLAVEFENARKVSGISIRELATMIGTSTSQVQRLLHARQGGSLTLNTICRAADALDLSVTIHVRKSNHARSAKVLPIGTTAWAPSDIRVPDRSLNSASVAVQGESLRMASGDHWRSMNAEVECPRIEVRT